MRGLVTISCVPVSANFLTLSFGFPGGPYVPALLVVTVLVEDRPLTVCNMHDALACMPQLQLGRRDL
jgi:hypothetical protein